MDKEIEKELVEAYCWWDDYGLLDVLRIMEAEDGDEIN